MRSIFAAFAAVLLALAASPAHAEFLTGYLAQCTGVAAGSCTEATGGSYARQPITFSDPVRGVTVNRVPYSFGAGSVGTIAGRAIYDAATNGHLLAVLPLASSATLNPDQGDVGTLSITVTGLTNTLAALYSANIASGGTIGTTPDGSTVTAGVPEAISRGELVPQGYAVQRPLTGFTITPADTVTTLALAPAGTLATGTLTLPSPQSRRKAGLSNQVSNG